MLAILVLAMVNLFWGLGSSSYFGDEVYSVRAASEPFSGVLDLVRSTEVAAPLYYWILHVWIAASGSTSEAVVRIPSAIAGLVLVGSTVWLGYLVAGRRAALIAGLLAALSPLVLLYAQQARAYVFAAAAICLTVASLLQAFRSQSPGFWLCVSGVLAALGIWLHYTAALVVAPLCAYMLLWSPQFKFRIRLAYCIACGAAALAVLPLALDQAALHPPTLIYADLRLGTASSVFSTPFDTRTYVAELLSPRLLGAGIVIASAVGWLAWGRAARDRQAWSVIFIAALAAPLGLLLAGAFGANTATSRYAAVAVGPMIGLVAACASVAPWRPRLVLITTATTLALIGTIDQHRRDGLWPDTRNATAFVAKSWKGNDLLVTQPPGFAVATSVSFYAGRLLPPGAELTDFESPDFLKAVEARRRFWTITGKLPRAEYQRRASRIDYTPTSITRFPGNETLQVTRVIPLLGRGKLSRQQN